MSVYGLVGLEGNYQRTLGMFSSARLAMGEAERRIKAALDLAPQAQLRLQWMPAQGKYLLTFIRDERIFKFAIEPWPLDAEGCDDGATSEE